jgi:hypothetical protein
VLVPGRTATSIPGQVPRMDQLPPGCRFAPRCPLAEQVCLGDDPELVDDNHNAVACHPLNRHILAGDGGLPSAETARPRRGRPAETRVRQEGERT